MPRSHIVRQSDFSGGAMLAEAERRDQLEQMRAGLVNAVNVRIEALCNLKERPGRRVTARTLRRTETIFTTDQRRWRLAFGEGTINIYNKKGNLVASDAGYPWLAAEVKQISYAVVNNQVFLGFDDTGIHQVKYQPDNGSWTFKAFSFATGQDGEVRAPYYRFPETKGITMNPSASTGDITVTFSDKIDTYVGQYLRYYDCEIIVTSLPNPTPTAIVNAHVTQSLPGSQVIGVNNGAGYKPGQAATGSVSGVESTIYAVAGNNITVQLAKGGDVYDSTIPQEHLVTATATSAMNASSGVGPPKPDVHWDEIAYGQTRGWAHGVLFDRRRLIFYDMPALPNAISWSVVDSFHDFYPGGDPADAIFEFVPSACHVRHVLGGPDQFCFTDKGTYFIPISDATPLAPGSVEFTLISSDPCSTVRPTTTPDGLVFIGEDLNRVLGIVQTGAVAKPYGTIDIGEYATDRFSNPVCLASAAGGVNFPEKYIYVVNADGTVAVGRAEIRNRWVGWVTWASANTVLWVCTAPNECIFTTEYDPGVTLMEAMDASLFLDGSIDYLDPPPAAAPDPGQGPLWYLPGREVTIMDGGLIKGIRTVDADGFIIPLAGDDWDNSAGLPDVVNQAGLPYHVEVEPFIPNIPEGTPYGQTFTPRRIVWATVRVQHSTGFSCMKRTIPIVNWDEDALEQPVLRKLTYRFKQLGRGDNPRCVVTKDTPGRLSIIEIAMEVSI